MNKLEENHGNVGTHPSHHSDHVCSDGTDTSVCGCPDWNAHIGLVKKMHACRTGQALISPSISAFTCTPSSSLLKA